MLRWLVNFMITGWVQASKFITTGGTSSQFVKGDGSLDATTYSTQTDIDNSIDDIEIGGRNYINGFYNRKWAKFTSEYELPEEKISNSELNFDGTIVSGNNRYYLVVPVDGGVQYTFSSEVTESTGGYFLYREKDNTNNDRSGQLTIKNGQNGVGYYGVVGKFSFSYIPDIRVKSIIIEIGSNGSTASSITIKNLKLEKGNKATAWTPAPEDQVTDWDQTEVDSFDYLKNVPVKLKAASDADVDNWNEAHGWGDFRDYGLGTELGATGYGQDLNNINNSGLYRSHITSINAAHSSYSMILHMQYQLGNSSQLAMSRGFSSDMRIRSQANGVYSDWKTIWDSRNLTKVTQLTNDAGYITATGNTTYLTNGLPELKLGTDTVGKLQTAKNLNDWITWKDFASAVHTHTVAQVVGLQGFLDGKEPTFSKNTAFNKPFGTGLNQVPHGNDGRINNGQTAFGWGNHAGLYSLLNHTHSVFSTGVAGFVPARVGAVSTKFLREDGTWVVPTNSTYRIVTPVALATGTETTARVVSAKVLYDWITLANTANRDRANHTGSQSIFTIIGLQNALNLKANTDDLSTVAFSGDYNDLVGKPDLSGFDNIDFYDSLGDFPLVGSSGDVLYLAKDSGILYRWSGSGYVVTSGQLAIGETADTAYRGDRGKIAYDHSQSAHAPVNAQKNVKTDWNAATGDAELLNKPTSFPPSTHTHTIAQVTGLQAELNLKAVKTEVAASLLLKVDKVAGKELSSNDYTTVEKNKLAGIEALAQKNVQSNWNSSTGDAAILNKPTKLSEFIDDLTYSTQTLTAGDNISINGSEISAVNTTYEVFSNTGAGLVPQRLTPLATVKYLREDGTWVTPTNTTYSKVTEVALNAGTEATTRAVDAKTLHDWLENKAYAKLTDLNLYSLIGHTHEIAEVTGLIAALAGKAPTTHSHTIAQVTGLQGALDGKAPATHTHTLSQITDLAAGTASDFNGIGTTPQRTWSGTIIATWANAKFALSGHTHTISEITDLGIGVASDFNGIGTTTKNAWSAAVLKDWIDNYQFNRFSYGGSETIDLSILGTIVTIRRAALSGGDVTAPINSNVLTIEPNAVTEAKIASAAVTANKIASNSINVFKIQNSAVTFAKMQGINAESLLGNGLTTVGDVEAIDIGTNLSISTVLGRRVIRATDTTYPAGTSALLDTGTNNNERVYTPRILSEWMRLYGMANNSVPVVSLLSGKISANTNNGFYASGNPVPNMLQFPRYMTISDGSKAYGLLFDNANAKIGAQLGDGDVYELVHTGNAATILQTAGIVQGTVRVDDTGPLTNPDVYLTTVYQILFNNIFTIMSTDALYQGICGFVLKCAIGDTGNKGLIIQFGGSSYEYTVKTPTVERFQSFRFEYTVQIKYLNSTTNTFSLVGILHSTNGVMGGPIVEIPISHNWQVNKYTTSTATQSLIIGMKRTMVGSPFVERTLNFINRLM